MSRLIERTVQELAQEFLRERYAKKARGQRVFSRIEVRTTARYGGKRADGFMAFRHRWLGLYVVSMEAKSFKTLPAIKPYRDDRIFMFNSLYAGLLICLLGPFYALFKMDDAFWQFLLPLNGFVLGTLGYALATRNSFRHKVVDVVKQVGQYPADEQWLAFSQDSLSDISIEAQRHLERICRYRGIGIVIVHHARRIEIMLKPKSRWRPFRNMLKYYTVEDEVRDFLK